MRKKKWLCVVLCTLLLLSGCTFGEGIDEETGAINRVCLEIEHAEGSVTVTAEGNRDFENCSDSIQANRITHHGATPLITEVFSCADFGSMYSGSYTVAGSEKNLKNTTFCFSLPEQEYETISCGVNYYDLIMEGSAMDCKTIRIHYAEQVALEQVSGEFHFLIFPLSDTCPMKIGIPILTLSGDIENCGNVRLSWDGERFCLESDQSFVSIEVSAESANRVEKQTATAEGGMRYEIRIIDGVPVIQEAA